MKTILMRLWNSMTRSFCRHRNSTCHVIQSNGLCVCHCHDCDTDWFRKPVNY
jgi:hypothetical protein